VIPNFDAAPAYTNIVFLPVIFISGSSMDVDNAPQFLRDVAQVLPLTHIIDGLSAALVTGRLAGRPRRRPGRRGRVGRLRDDLRGARIQLAGEARLDAKTTFRHTGGPRYGGPPRGDARSRSNIH
jgi:hypothetical protein